MSYTSGKVHRETLVDDHRQLMVRVLGVTVHADQVDSWSRQSLEDQPPTPESLEQREAVGRTLGEFEILSQIGRGGMGVVYRAWQPSLGRQVALKSLMRTGDAQAEARFGREIRALGRVEHPHLIKVFTSGVDEDQWFYAMELIEGEDLTRISDELVGADASTLGDNQWRHAITTALEKARSGEETVAGAGTTESMPTDALPHPARTVQPARPSGGENKAGRGHVAQVVEIIRQVATATHALHESGVVHRDIKPGNIMLLGDQCHAVLMDLGIAQIADEVEGRLTRTRQFIGTLRYASPEQLVSASTVDRRADIYSPGAIVLKCLERDRDRRYQTAAELADDLERWQRGEPVRAQQPTLTYIFSKHVRRHKLRFATAAALALLAVAGTVTAFLLVNDAKNDAIIARNEAVAARNRARDLAEKEAALRKQTERREAKLMFEQSYTTCVEKDPEKGILSLACSPRVADRANHEELVRAIQLKIAAWVRPIHPLRAVMPTGAPVEAMAFSSDGKMIASGNTANQAQLWDTANATRIGGGDDV